MEIPKEPVLFLKATTALAGAGDDVVIPPGAEKVDWEVELAIVIGHRASHVSAKRPWSRLLDIAFTMITVSGLINSSERVNG
jgi:Fumarylacetoacetate (FAA) hydrolase family